MILTHRLLKRKILNLTKGLSHSRFYSNSKMVTTGVKKIVWMDLEMTGLDIDKDHILEVACLVSDGQLNVIAEGPHVIVHQPDEVLNAMGDWCTAHHGESGLTEASRNSKYSIEATDNKILQFLKKHVPEGCCPLAGNSIYMDRLFIRKYMPKVNMYLHYRVIDVSTIKELAKRWYQSDYSKVPTKQFKHRAMDDIHESIAELKYYRENIFKEK